MTYDADQLIEMLARVRAMMDRLDGGPGDTRRMNEALDGLLALLLSRRGAPFPDSDPGGPFAEDVSLREISRRYVRVVVERAPTKTEACRILGITDKTLNRLLREAEGRRGKESS